MDRSFIAFYEHVVDIDLHVMIDLILENFINQSLIYDLNIFETERHDFIIVQAFIGNKYHLLLIFGRHPDLIIFREDIHKA